MRKEKLIYFIILICMSCSCNYNESATPEKWSKEKLDKWFESGIWKCNWKISPDESVNRRSVAVYYMKNKKMWDKAFYFLKNADLVNMSPGRYKIDGDRVFVNIDEYNPRDEINTRFEAHRQYIDVQYIVYGEEKIGITDINNMADLTGYNRANDVVFSEASQYKYRLATPESFFIFFPEDAHRPSVKTDAAGKVRKVVVKIRI
ncbi:MAG: YhcH/YjgK/YiaL family protein [Tannerella sp.]|nr:YhcH/YjgK/YiaL family protein [Tannerella sp.]